MTKKPEPDPVTFEAVLDADLFSRAALCRSIELARYYLNGVLIERRKDGGAVLVATDGSILAAIRDQHAIVKGEAIVGLDPAMLKVLAGKVPAKDRLFVRRLLVVRGYKSGRSKAFVVDQPLSTDRDSETAAHLTREMALSVLDEPDQRVRASQFWACIIDGNYPKWRTVIPPADLEPGAAVGKFNASLLGRLADALCTDKSHGLRMVASANNTMPALVVAYNAVIDGFGVVMPLRDETSNVPAVPEWARPPA
jgi:hypothetical protein